MGWTIEGKTEGANKSPYFTTENIDPKWLEATGAGNGHGPKPKTTMAEGKKGTLGDKGGELLLEAGVEKNGTEKK